MDCGDYLSEERATDCDFGELERDLARMAHDTRPDLDQAALNAAQRPIGNLFREVYTVQENAEVVGQSVKLKPDFIVAEPLAGQTGPGNCVFAFLDMPLCGAALIVELKQLFGRIGEVGHDEAKAREQLSKVPFNFGNNLTRFAP